MHISFVPITEDGRLSAKEIVGNKKKLTKWQDGFWQHMTEKYPDLARGRSAGITGRTHIPPRRPRIKAAVRYGRREAGLIVIHFSAPCRERGPRGVCIIFPAAGNTNTTLCEKEWCF